MICNIRRVDRFCFGLLVFIDFYCLAERASSLTEFVKERFVADVSVGMNDFRVYEASSKPTSDRAFFRKALGIDVLQQASAVERREIFIEDKVRKAHLGILALRYQNSQRAQQIQASLAKQGQFFKGTEILTRFVAIPLRDSVLVIYSETILNENVKSFFDHIPWELAKMP